MEGQKNKVTMLVAEINRVNEGNQKLKSMVKSMTGKCKYLQEQISFLVQQQKLIDRSQVYYSKE